MLENTLFKIKSDKKLRVGYFGGSITEGAGSSDHDRTCYRAIITQYLKDKYPECDITEIYAAIGGTGTSYGMFRMVPDLLCHRPDLVFVEFAVNDYGDNYDNIRAQTETIFRKLLLADANTDIIILFSTSEEVIGNVEAGLEFDSRSAQLAAAHRYNVMSIDQGAALHAAIRNSGAKITDFIPDTLHPNDRGYRAMADCIISHLERLLDADTPAALVPHEIPSPESTHTYDGATLIPTSELCALECRGFREKNAPDGERFPVYLAADGCDDSFYFEFDGECLGFTWVGGYTSADLLVSIDGGDEIRVKSWDHALRSFHRMQNALFAKGLENTHHRATVRLDCTDADAERTEKCGISGVFLCK